MSALGRLSEIAMERHVPLSVLLELTGRCNLDCGHCYLELDRPPPELDTAQVLEVIDQLSEAGTLFLTLSGGEVLLRPDLIPIARHARARGLSIRIFTNATRVTRALARQIAEVTPLAVEVSIYGAHGERHDAVTGRRRSLRRSLRGIVLLRRAGVRVGIKAPLVELVAGEVDTLHRLADRLGAGLFLDPYLQPRRDGGRQPFRLQASTEKLAEALRDPRLGWLPREALPPPRSAGEVPCAVGRRVARIGPNGDVYPCSTYPRAVGNVRERSFREIWAGGAVLDRLRALRTGDLGAECVSCRQSGYCGRCSAVAALETGDDRARASESCRVAEAKELAFTGVRRAGGAGVLHLPIVSVHG
jgi:radical SAM protein with 4Fe4S-binding SPASM domain